MGSSGEPGRCEHGKLYAEFCWDCVDRSAALGSSGSGEALSEARLAEIREQVDEYARKVYKQADVEFGYGLHELLAEVERQRTALAAAEAREAALAAKNNQAMVIVEALDALGWDAFIGRELWEQAARCWPRLSRRAAAMARDGWMARVRQMCEDINRESPSPALMAAWESFEMVADEYNAALLRLVQQATLSGLHILTGKQASERSGGDGG